MKSEVKEEFFNAFKELKRKFRDGETSEEELFALTAEFHSFSCGRLSHYNSPIPVSIALVMVKNGKDLGFLACKRGIAPCIGGVAFPGGFVDEGENTKEGAIRELFEETGLVLEDESLWMHIAEKNTAHNHLVVFYLYQEVVEWSYVQKSFEKLEDKSETLDIVFLHENDEMCFPLHKKIHTQECDNWNAILNKYKKD